MRGRWDWRWQFPCAQNEWPKWVMCSNCGNHTKYELSTLPACFTWKLKWLKQVILKNTQVWRVCQHLNFLNEWRENFFFVQPTRRAKIESSFFRLENGLNATRQCILRLSVKRNGWKQNNYCLNVYFMFLLCKMVIQIYNVSRC